MPIQLRRYNLSSYPFLDSVPADEDIGFTCDPKLHDGFYASIKYNCQVSTLTYGKNTNDLVILVAHSYCSYTITASTVFATISCALTTQHSTRRHSSVISPQKLTARTRPNTGSGKLCFPLPYRVKSVSNQMHTFLGTSLYTRLPPQRLRSQPQQRQPRLLQQLPPHG